MKILVVGAGAVGQTFGWHLQRGGAEVSFFAKSKYVAALRAGCTLYNLRGGGRRAPICWSSYEVISTLAEVTAGAFDAALITVSSDALRAGSWVAELVAAAPGATICGMQPGREDEPFVAAAAGQGRVVWGMIELIAYHAPLAGEQVPEPGVAFWVPPRMGFPMCGPEARVRPLVEAFRAGGLSARVEPGVLDLTALGSIALNLHMVALEAAGWTLQGVRADRALLDLTVRAVGEASAAVAAERGIERPLWLRWLRPWQVRQLAWLAPKVLPIELDAYLPAHFTKVGQQTTDALEGWIALAEASGGSSRALRALQVRRGGG